MSEVKVQTPEEVEKVTKTVETNIENEEPTATSQKKEEEQGEQKEKVGNEEGQKQKKLRTSLLLEEFQKVPKEDKKEKQKRRTKSLKHSPKNATKTKMRMKKVNNVGKEEKKERSKKKKKLKTGPMLQRFMKPAPKIYKKKKIGQKKYVIKAEPKANIESESFYAKKKKSKKRNFNTYEMVDFEDDETDEEEQSVKFWSKKNMIRSMSNPRGFARLLGSKMNMIDEIQRLVRMDNMHKKGKKENLFRSVDISLKNRNQLSSVESRKRETSRESEWDPNRKKIIKVGTSSSIWEQTTLKKQIHKEKQKKKKRFKHLIYSSVQVEKSEQKNPIKESKEKDLKVSYYRPSKEQQEELRGSLPSKTSTNLKMFSRTLPVGGLAATREEEQLKLGAFASNMEVPQSPKFSATMQFATEEPEKGTSNFVLHKVHSRMTDNADGITVELEEDKSVCLEDMETKLCFFFKKTLVYASKIELLKLKAQKENGEHNIYSLFRQFCNPDNGKLTITSMQMLVEVLQFPMEEYDISSVMLFLEKFKEVEPDSILELEYGEFRELFVSHKVNTPEIYLFSNWTPEISKQFNLPDSEFYLLRQILMLTSRQIQDVSRIVGALRAYTADSLFNYISLFNEENDKIEGHLNNFFHNGNDFEEMKESFQVQIDFNSQRVQNQVKNKRPKSANAENLGPSFSNNIATKSFRNPSFSGTPKNEIKIEEKEEEANQSEAKEEELEKEEEDLGKEEEELETRSNYSSLVKPESILNRHTRYKKVRKIKPNFKFASRRVNNRNKQNPEDNHQEEVEKMNAMIRNAEKNVQVHESVQRSLETQANMIDVSTIRNFLNFHGVMFLEEDLELVMYCMGSAHGIIDREAFKRFFYSPLWD